MVYVNHKQLLRDEYVTAQVVLLTDNSGQRVDIGDLVTALLCAAGQAARGSLPHVLVKKGDGRAQVHYTLAIILAMGIGLSSPPFGVGFHGACAIGRVSPDDANGDRSSSPSWDGSWSGSSRQRVIDRAGKEMYCHD
jgi:hypothetical protein